MAKTTNFKKEERARDATIHVAKMNELFKPQIKESIEQHMIYVKVDKKYKPRRMYSDTEIEVQSMGVQECIYETTRQYPDEKIAVLNFASYTHPGGGYIKGSMAQEESLCSVSTLYNVLNSKSIVDAYYNRNKHYINFGLYGDAALYTPGIIYTENDLWMSHVNVITCAAPNVSRITQNRMYDETMICEAVRRRILHVITIAAKNRNSVLILGAFGCGVFGINPYIVANAFRTTLKQFNGTFKHIVFAIPKSRFDDNYDIFRSVLLEREDN